MRTWSVAALRVELRTGSVRPTEGRGIADRTPRRVEGDACEARDADETYDAGDADDSAGVRDEGKDGVTGDGLLVGNEIEGE